MTQPTYNLLIQLGHGYGEIIYTNENIAETELLQELTYLEFHWGPRNRCHDNQFAGSIPVFAEWFATESSDLDMPIYIMGQDPQRDNSEYRLIIERNN